MLLDFRSVEIRVWVILMVLTAGSFGYGMSLSQLDANGAGHLAFGVIIVVALAKAWLVINYFMELRHASQVIRRIANLWMLLTGGIIFGVHFFL